MQRRSVRKGIKTGGKCLIFLKKSVKKPLQIKIKYVIIIKLLKTASWSSG